MKVTKYLTILTAFVAAILSSACNDDKTYAELLADENRYTNNYLADQVVINQIPADTVFEYGEDAPFYRLDEDGNLYMKVLDPGTEGNMVEDDELIYFRFSRWNLGKYEGNGQFAEGYTPEGNNAALGGNYYFRYNNYSLSSSYNYGEGIQVPLKYLPLDAHVLIIIKSQLGVTSEIAYVIPYLYDLRYFRPKV